MFYRIDDKDNFIFPIDNFYGDETEIEGLRKALTDQIYDKFESEEINIQWGIFHLLLRSEYEKPGICSLPEAVKLGLACGLRNESNVIDALKFLHFRFGTILFYHKVPSLSDRVICDPNLIFRPLTQIIADSFGADPQTAEEIRKTGIVPLETFKKACHKEKQNQNHMVSKEELVDLLKHCNILSELTLSSDGVHEECDLFMPCLLKPYDNTTQQQSKKHYLNAFLFTFSPHGFQPIGLFYALITKLLSLKDFNLNHDCIKYRNKIEFRYGNTSIKILSMFRYFEVCVDCRCGPNRRVTLQSILHKQVNSIMTKLPHTKKSKAEVSFYCPVSIGNEDSPPHIAKLVEVDQMDLEDKPRILECKHCSDLIVDLTKEQEMWFTQNSCTISVACPENTFLDNCVDAIKASMLMKSCSNKWEKIGQSLNIKQSARDDIKSLRGNDVDILLEAVLNEWIDINGRAATWRKLIEVLREMELINLAETVLEGVSHKPQPSPLS